MASTATAYNPPIRRDPFSISTDHANGHASDPNPSPSTPSTPYSPHPDFAGISIRAFLLGLTLGSSIFLTLFLAFNGNPLWRLPFFLSALSLFHFLEYQVTASYNPTVATISAFLLSQNGRAYNIAHSLAFLECFAHYTIFPQLHLKWEDRLLSYAPEPFRNTETKPGLPFHQIWLILGFTMLLLGQITRTIAMAKAGSNFNHTVQMKKRQGHVLVTDGIYAWLRHPSYFGFFWWGLGTQVVLGNAVCLLGYVIVLWRFFRHRIRGTVSSELCLSTYLLWDRTEEEILLVKFFGDEYVEYRKKTGSGLPLIR